MKDDESVMDENPASSADTARSSVAAAEIAALVRRGRIAGLLVLLGRFLRRFWWSSAVLVGAFAWRRLNGQSLDWWDLLLVGLLLVPVVLALWVSIPAWRYGEMQDLVGWARWRDLLHFLPKLNRALLRNSPQMAATEITLRRAQALAGLGDVEHALRILQSLEGKIPPFQFATYASILHTAANNPQAQLDALEKAHELRPDDVGLLLDMAMNLVLRKKDPADARKRLQEAETHPIPENIRWAADQVRGLIALEEGRDAEARENLENALKHLAPLKIRLCRFSERFCKAFLTIACARLGDGAAARRYFEAAETYLEARGEDGILARCREALAALPSGAS